MSGNTQGRVTVHENGDANSYALRSADNRWLVAMLHNGEAGLGQQRENMRRLAACWNACDGIDTDLLEAAPYKDSASFMAFLEMEAQRDASMAMLSELMDTELAAMACVGSDSPVEDLMGRIKQAVDANTEPQRIAADLDYNAMKTTGELQRREADRALAEQIKWEAP